MKKIKKAFVIFSVLSLLICCNGCTRRNSKNNENKSDEMYEATMKEVDKINENSNFMGLNLLEDASENDIYGIPQTYRTDTCDIIYYADSYHKSRKVVSIELTSKDTNLLGIAPGDNKQVIEEKLDGTNFAQTESYFDNSIRYEAYHIIITFELTEDGYIDTIGIGVGDPENEMKDY